MDILQKFKSSIYHVLVATDVAARGLDIKSVKSVVNFDIAKDMDMHVHRIGRTGRAGDKDGTAYTLITQKEARFAGFVSRIHHKYTTILPLQLVSISYMDVHLYRYLGCKYLVCGNFVAFPYYVSCLIALDVGRFRSKRDSRKGGGKKCRGRGGGGRGVRWMDLGLGIGYNTESNSSSSNTVSSRSAALTPQWTGMMSQFKTKFE
ncbi:hypothetical protein C1H46_030138 [Malus baccata]|uniref:Helicase C-terminal domain-containing protein n=1 Tax=Malus baccata TaxID=106549 RepID=A0A540LD14_MALBA|nr:hypothetical protein C1H46_030138 [Malus baccata]